MAELSSEPGRVADDDPPHWDAVVALYLDTQTKARRAAAWILSSPFDFEIEDVIHDAIVKAARNYHTLKQSDHASNWFLKIVICTAYDRRRIRSRRSRMESPLGAADDPEQVYGGLARGISPEESVLLRSGFEFLRSLPEKQRVAYLLKHFFGFNRDDIAEVLQCSPRTVNTHIRRAQAKADKKFSPAADIAGEAQQAHPRRSLA
jgi:RNA polymerase sigma-70 factor (ECF subfamily)